MQIDLFSCLSRLLKKFFVVRQAQGERINTNNFNTGSVRPEPVEG
jgi:hypothetical protein